MNTPSPSSETRPPPDEASYQFGMRIIVVVMVGVSVAAAFAAPFLRQLNRGQALSLAAYLFAIIVIAVLVIVVTGMKRRRLEKEAGELRFVFLRPHVVWKRALILTYATVVVATPSVTTLMFVRGNILTPPPGAGMQLVNLGFLHSLIISAGVPGMVLGNFISMLLARSERVQLRERGMLVGWQLFALNTVARFGWSWKEQYLLIWGKSFLIQRLSFRYRNMRRLMLTFVSGVPPRLILAKFHLEVFRRL